MFDLQRVPTILVYFAALELIYTYIHTYCLRMLVPGEKRAGLVQRCLEEVVVLADHFKLRAFFDCEIREIRDPTDPTCEFR